MDKIQILNTKIHNLSAQETLEKIERAIRDKKQIHHVVVNAGKIVAMQTVDTSDQIAPGVSVSLRQ